MKNNKETKANCIVFVEDEYIFSTFLTCSQMSPELFDFRLEKRKLLNSQKYEKAFRPSNINAIVF